MKKIYICAREKEFISGEENFQPISKAERLQLNPKYIRRLKDYINNLEPPFILISRSPFMTILLDAAGFIYETLYL